jgi:ferritin-like metal-binding protein YciE
MAKITERRELLEHKLASILYVERELADKVLPELLEVVGNPQLRNGIQTHLAQTRGHVANLEQAFSLLGLEPETEKSAAFDGIVKDHNQLAKKLEARALDDIVHAAAVAKTEHFEIAAYDGMINLAESFGETEIVHMLEENLDQEREALEQVNRRLAGMQHTTA